MSDLTQLFRPQPACQGQALCQRSRKCKVHLRMLAHFSQILGRGFDPGKQMVDLHLSCSSTAGARIFLKQKLLWISTHILSLRTKPVTFFVCPFTKFQAFPGFWALRSQNWDATQVLQTLWSQCICACRDADAAEMCWADTGSAFDAK